MDVCLFKQPYQVFKLVLISITNWTYYLKEHLCNFKITFIDFRISCLIRNVCTVSIIQLHEL